eukprot:CAMPEP_0185907436 /NCGR_PEP_ID=MMETSP0196C-20130402/7108_1 /TAXON_ID=2932 /ORGANISM="Alexandrium fundyense, Strain CCMP1719" /LENGTH=30 /DNA_ID= /DNA_START= /DNA_END= /DNA_ORIENTATION=
MARVPEKASSCATGCSSSGEYTENELDGAL